MTTPTTTRMTAPVDRRRRRRGRACRRPGLPPAADRHGGARRPGRLDAAAPGRRRGTHRGRATAGGGQRGPLRADEHGRDPLHTALESAPGLVPLLRELGAPVDAASAAYLDDAERLRTELDDGAPLTDPVTGVDLLTLAAAGGAADSARTLLDRGEIGRAHV